MDRDSAYSGMSQSEKEKLQSGWNHGGNWRAASGNTFQYPVQNSISKLFRVSALEL
jgi:hypothetical protein